jgi:uncharacterized protein
VSLAVEILRQAWATWLVASPWVLLGLALAGVLHAFVSDGWIARWMGAPGFAGVARAALVGVPIPVCSCGVLPLAVAVEKKGASRPATMSFLVTTPESSVDAVVLTWGLMGPVMAIARPIAAFVSAFVAGGLAILFPGRRSQPAAAEAAEPAAAPPPVPARRRSRLAEALHFAAVELADDILLVLVLGVLAAGVVGAVVPDDLGAFGLVDTFPATFVAMGVVLVAGLVLYTCASASTPLGAALLAKGLSPGTVLVFLLAGPATSLASIAVLWKSFGRRFVGLYLAGICVGAVACGLLLDAAIVWFGWTLRAGAAGDAESPLRWLETLSAAVLGGLAIWRFGAGAARRGWREVRAHYRGLRALLSPDERG